MHELRWRYADGAQDRALPPERARLSFGDQDDDSPFRGRSHAERWRAIERGYRTQPADCPPVRALARYGFVVRCPGEVRVRRSDVERRERVLERGRAAFGTAVIEGDDWPGSDSGLVGSWILGSGFIKVHTGVELLFPDGTWVYQGPVPNRPAVTEPLADLEVMAGVEPPSNSRRIVLDGQAWTVSPLNIIAELPAPGLTGAARRGDLLAWFFPVPAGGTWQLTELVGSRPEGER